MTTSRPLACMDSCAIKLPAEPVLDGVLEEDRANVRNIIYVLHALKLCNSWSVSPKQQGYEISGSIENKPGITVDVELRDMELIRKVDPLRVTSVCARMLGGPNATLTVVVFVLRRSEPVMLEEQEIVQVKRKRKFWSGS